MRFIYVWYTQTQHISSRFATKTCTQYIYTHVWKWARMISCFHSTNLIFHMCAHSSSQSFLCWHHVAPAMRDGTIQKLSHLCGFPGMFIKRWFHWNQVRNFFVPNGIIIMIVYRMVRMCWQSKYEYWIFYVR